MKLTDEDLSLIRGAIYVHCLDFENEDQAARKAWDIIAPLVLERAAREVEENYESTWYIAERIRGLAKP